MSFAKRSYTNIKIATTYRQDSPEHFVFNTIKKDVPFMARPF